MVESYLSTGCLCYLDGVRGFEDIFYLECPGVVGCLGVGVNIVDRVALALRGGYLFCADDNLLYLLSVHLYRGIEIGVVAHRYGKGARGAVGGQGIALCVADGIECLVEELPASVEPGIVVNLI